MYEEKMQEKTELDNEELKSLITRAFINRGNKYVLFDQQKDVEKFIHFVSNVRYEKVPVPYNILIVCDDMEKSKEFCDNLSFVAEDLRIFGKQIGACDIKTWFSLKKSFKDFEDVYGCIVIRNVTADDLKGGDWEWMADMIRQDQTPSLNKIMYMTEEAAQSLKENYEDIYYRYFANDYHIVMNKKEVEPSAIYQIFLSKLENEGYQIEQEFADGIRVYIDTVYLKSVEREMSFIEDLYNRVIRAVLSREKASRNIDKECVPYYRKPESAGAEKQENGKKSQEAEKQENEKESAEIKKQKPDEEKKEEYPAARVISRNDKPEENVLFFYLSVLSNRKKMSRYRGKCQEQKIYYTGISQLEAGTKHILYNLAMEGKKLDRIVIVESLQTRTDDLKEFTESFWDNPEEMKQYYASSVCFYKQRIKDYLRRKESKDIFKDTTKTYYDEYKSFEVPFTDTVEYTDDEIEQLFYDIPTYVAEDELEGKVDNAQSECYKEQSLKLFSEIIHGIQGEDCKLINLYVDVQGGIRSAVSQIDAVLELLKDRNVNIKGRYAIKGFNPNKEKVYEVAPVDEEYKAYELVSSMAEFKRYGRGQGLTEFFAKDNEPETQQIIELIRKISDAIALCNVEEFENQINALRTVNARPAIKELLEEKNSQISIVFQDIIEDYAPLLREESTTFDIVKWCVKKSFYQQAITLIESLMPKMLLECGFLYYNPFDMVNVEKKDGNVEKESIFWVCRYVKGRSLAWKDNRNLLFEHWVGCNYDSSSKTYFGVPAVDIKNLSKDSDFKAEALKFQKSNYVHWDEVNYTEKNKFKVEWKQIEYRKYSQNLNKDPDADVFCMFAALSRILKETRNSINHAVSRESYEAVERMLETYLVLGECLRLNERHKKSMVPYPGMKARFIVTERGKNKNLQGMIEGIYKGTIQKGSLTGVDIDDMCKKTVQVEVESLNGDTYIVKYIPEEKEEDEAGKTEVVNADFPEPGEKVEFKIGERGGSTGRTLRGKVNGVYKGVIEKNYLEGLSNGQLDEMCDTTVYAEVVRVNGEIYILSYTPDGKEEKEAQKQVQEKKKAPVKKMDCKPNAAKESGLSVSLAEMLGKINI